MPTIGGRIWCCFRRAVDTRLCCRIGKWSKCKKASYPQPGSAPQQPLLVWNIKLNFIVEGRLGSEHHLTLIVHIQWAGCICWVMLKKTPDKIFSIDWILNSERLCSIRRKASVGDISYTQYAGTNYNLKYRGGNIEKKV